MSWKVLGMAVFALAVVLMIADYHVSMMLAERLREFFVAIFGGKVLLPGR